MSLSIDLLNKDLDICSKISKTLSRTKIRQFKCMEDLSAYHNFKKQIDPLLNSHVLQVRNALTTNRVYNTLGDVYFDSHHEIEKLCVGQYARKYVTIFSLEDSLDLILHLLCGCDIKAFKKLDNYQLISRVIMKIDTNLLEHVSIGSLIGLDKKLDDFLIKLRLSLDETDEVSFIKSFFDKIMFECNDITLYSSVFLSKHLNLTLASKSTCSIVFYSDTPLNEVIDLIFEKFTYKVLLRSFTKGEYLKNFRSSYRLEV